MYRLRPTPVTQTTHYHPPFSRHLSPHLFIHRLARDLYQLVRQPISIDSPTRNEEPPDGSQEKRIALHIDDPELRWQLSELLMKSGAVVHGARDEVELQRLLDKLGVVVVVATLKPVRIGLN